MNIPFAFSFSKKDWPKRKPSTKRTITGAELQRRCRGGVFELMRKPKKYDDVTEGKACWGCEVGKTDAG